MSRSKRRSRQQPGRWRQIRFWLLLGAACWIVITAVPVLILRWVNPPTTAFMLQARHTLSQSAGHRVILLHRWIDYCHISGSGHLAVVAAEDQKFPHHFGFDWDAIATAIKAHVEHDARLRGASTITQQTAKNLFLWPAHSFVRKALEAWFTVLLELFWSKQRILEVYLNIAQFGDRVFGIGAAARHFFNEPAGRLSRRQAALLAAVLPDPQDRHVRQPSAYLRKRQAQIAQQMRQLGPHYLGVIDQ